MGLGTGQVGPQVQPRSTRWPGAVRQILRGAMLSGGEGTAALVYHVDGLGSVRALTDSSKAVVQTYESDEFGIPITSAGGSSQPFGFTGEQRDPENNLVYLRARYYDPQIGRFIQRDPLTGSLQRPQTLNRYVYVHNRPCGFTDPSGLKAQAQTDCSQRPALPDAPPGEQPYAIDYDTIDRRILEMHAILAATGPELGFAQGVWIHRVSPSAPWDQARLAAAEGSPERQTLTDLGNFGFGATGRVVGYDELTLRAVGGVLQVITGKWPRDGTFFDSDRDERMIIAGSQYYDWFVTCIGFSAAPPAMVPAR